MLWKNLMLRFHAKFFPFRCDGGGQVATLFTIDGRSKTRRRGQNVLGFSQQRIEGQSEQHSKLRYYKCSIPVVSYYLLELLHIDLFLTQSLIFSFRMCFFNAKLLVLTTEAFSVSFSFLILKLAQWWVFQKRLFSFLLLQLLFFERNKCVTFTLL